MVKGGASMDGAPSTESAGQRYRPTESDAIWLARAVAGEGAPSHAVAQALCNRFLWLLQRNSPPYRSLADFVQRYAQPVNTRWMRGGDIFERRWKVADHGERRRLEIGHQRRVRHRELTDFSPDTLEAVTVALTRGPVDLSRPDVTDYAAPHVKAASHFVPAMPGSPGVNAFYVTRRAVGWQGYHVALVDLATIADTWARNLAPSSPSPEQRAEPLLAFGGLELVPGAPGR